MAYRSKSPPTLLLNDDDFGNTDSEGASSQETEKGSPNNNNFNTIDENLNDLLKTVSNIDDKQIVAEKEIAERERGWFSRMSKRYKEYIYIFFFMASI